MDDKDWEELLKRTYEHGLQKGLIQPGDPELTREDIVKAHNIAVTRLQYRERLERIGREAPDIIASILDGGEEKTFVVQVKHHGSSKPPALGQPVVIDTADISPSPPQKIMVPPGSGFAHFLRRLLTPRAFRTFVLMTVTEMQEEWKEAALKRESWLRLQYIRWRGIGIIVWALVQAVLPKFMRMKKYL